MERARRKMHVRWENGEAIVIWAYTMGELSLDDDDSVADDDDDDG
jgi:hypothetical protein